jgi:NAD(P)-dependent dehydrogenase (short-subunit alcohol dehydrogenase family)
MAAYVTSKGALTALTRAAALELAPDGIRVNAVLPGAIDTGMLRDGLNREQATGAAMDKKLKKLGGKHPVGRIGDPEEIGRTILALADNKISAFVTGQSVIIDGGATVRLSTE